MMNSPSYQVRVTPTADGDFCWAVVERHGLFRRRTLARSELQFLTRDGACDEGHKALHELTRPAHARAHAPVRVKALRQGRLPGLVFSRDGA